MPRKPRLVVTDTPVSPTDGGEPSGSIDMAGFTRRLYGQALRVLVEIEAGHETMAIDDQCKLLNTLGVLGKNLIAMIKGSVDESHAGSMVRKYSTAFRQPARRPTAPAAEDDALDLGGEDASA